MDEKLEALHKAIMEAPDYGNVNTEGIMIMGNLKHLKDLLELPAPVRRKSREEHLAELGDDDIDDI